MKVSLPPEFEQFIQEKVRSGQYSDENDVVRSALRVLREQEQLTSQDVDDLRDALAPALAALDRGEGAPWDPDELKRRVSAANRPERD